MYPESLLMLQKVLDKLIVEHNIDTELRAGIDGYQVSMFDYESGEPITSFSGESEADLLINMSVASALRHR